MRIVLKGGVWKNSEDEILKAAVMKYGLNQWARVASLLPRKTAKQCKARWYEWLDPGIKKTEWTREEEERLLHLAKLMPAQWRTIAPLIGRTAAQCLEHYEKLLDAAAAAATGSAASTDRREDPRRLRPGEIDPMPEIKPARPDPMDMDEDEKEMLSEARARLANTRGKKAKRKLRERMLDEARRLATLQKQRELKAAGIDTTKRKRKRTEGIDYANEVPFEKRAPAGFFSTAADDSQYAREKAAETADFKVTLLNKLEDERAADSEARARAEDKRKLKRLVGSSLPEVLRAEAEADPLNMHKRSKLMLPAPVVSGAQLEEAARIGAAAGGAGMLLDDLTENGSVATSGLLARYGSDGIRGLPPPSGARSLPSAASSREAILQEARNLAAITAAQTPLLGGENVPLEAGTGYAGATPARRQATSDLRGAEGAAWGATPVTHSRANGGAGTGRGSVVTGGSVVGVSALGAAARDAMGLNREDADDDASFLGDSASAFGDDRSFAGGSTVSRSRDLGARVLLGLQSLPAPKGEYDVFVPETEDDGTDASDGRDGSASTVEDAGEEEARAAARAAAAYQRELARRSSVLRHEPLLPRPLLLEDEAITPPVSALAATAAEISQNQRAMDLVLAESLMRDEMLVMLKADAVKYPILHRFFRAPKRAPAVSEYEDSALQAARDLLEAEVTNCRISAEQAAGDVEALHPDAVADALGAADAHYVYVPTSRAYTPVAGAAAADRIAAYQTQLRTLAAHVERESSRLSKVESKLSTMLGGYVKRSGLLSSQLVASAVEQRDRQIELACFQRLLADESEAISSRLARAAAELQEETDRERELQGRYGGLMREMEQLRVQLGTR